MSASQLWAGEFGDAYLSRNLVPSPERSVFWRRFLQRVPVRSVLEVGCGHGINLEAMNSVPERIGVDINRKALSTLAASGEKIAAIEAPADHLPFPDGRFDLVFTCGLLIHQNDEDLPRVMAEMVRCSNKYVLAMEYFSPQPTEIPYRGMFGILFKRDYGRILENFGLLPVASGFLGKPQGWDDVTWWLFSRN